MAQYFEVVSQGDASSDQSHQFFNGVADNEGPQVRYILAEDTAQFPAQQLVLSTDQVMVLDGSQRQIQGVVIDQGHNYQPTGQSQQFGTLLQNMPNQSGQQIFFMENTNNPVGEPVQAVVEQNSSQPQQIVLNHQLSNSNSANRQLFQTNNPQRMVAQIRTAVRQTPVQLNQQAQSRSPLRPTLPQQVRQPQALPVRNLMPHSVVQRFRPAAQRPKQPVAQLQPENMVGTPRQVAQQMQQFKNLLGQGRSLQQQKQMTQVTQQQSQMAGGKLLAGSPQKTVGDLTQVQRMVQAVKHSAEMAQVTQQQTQMGSGRLLGGSPQKAVGDLAQVQRIAQTVRHSAEDELDDHDPAMNSTPGQVMDYKKMLEQRQQAGKHPILARLPGNILVTPGAGKQRQPEQQQLPATSMQSQLANDQVRQPLLATPTAGITQTVPQAKKQRAPAKPRNTSGGAKSPSPARQRNPKQLAVGGAGPQPPFGTVSRTAGTLAATNSEAVAKYSVQQQQHQQQPRFPNPPQLLQQQQQQQQQQQPTHQLHQQQLHHQQPITQNGAPNPNMSVGSNQMNYLITAPTTNRPQQHRPLPSYVPSSQIQQIIESTPVADEYSDSIRMLVLLESGEQRLITFTLPTEACTIQEILRQVRVPFTPETNIRVTEANSNGINYIVTVGNVSDLETGNEDEKMELVEPDQQVPQASTQPPVVPPPEPPKPVTPELPKLIPGRLAVCSACGYTGEDFNRCARCSRKLPENVKSIGASNPDGEAKKPEHSFSQPAQAKPTSTATKSEQGPKLPASVTKKRVSRPKAAEPESVVISSDEEEDEKKPSKSMCDQWLNKLGASISICPVTKEPSLNDIKKHVRRIAAEPENPINISLKCRTVRIGSYRFAPQDDVLIDSKCIIIKAPIFGSGNSEYKTIRVDRGDIVKMLICYNKALPVIFCYVNVGAAPIIREMLKLTKETGYYFDPMDEKDDAYRKITLLPDEPIDEHKSKFLELYGGGPISGLDELTVKEANNILIKACLNDAPTRAESFSEIKEILMYPKEGQGRLSINTEDYVCLAVDQFLNDKIIDFYLKYLWENLQSEQQEKVHVFSTFFYKRLTTKPTKAARKSHPYESDPNLTAAEKRHCRVKNWTKRINLFDKDFIVVPINENAHWFLAIICFPGLSGPQTFDGKPYNPEPKPKKKTKTPPVSDAKKEKPIPCEDPVLSDKDEAESDDSDMCSDCSEESTAVAPPTPTKTKSGPRPPIKQPCILIFDSLAGPSRSRVVATLRDYLTIEYKSKMDTEKVFDKDTIKGSSCKVPQQNNFTDCGLYVLQYVEQFFKDPIKDYYTPIKGIDKWFDELTVTKKREDICNLLKSLMTEAGTNVKILPEISLPTLSGKLIERQESEREQDAGEEEQEDMFTDIEDSEMSDGTSLNATQGSTEAQKSDDSFVSGDQDVEDSPVKSATGSVDEKSNIVTSSVSQTIKPTLSESSRRASNKDTLNYLKSKRIVRHKTPNEEPESKKTKITT